MVAFRSRGEIDMRRIVLGSVAAGLAAASLVGCGTKPAPTAAPAPTTAPTAKAGAGGHEEHPHEGPHGGALAEWGEHEYHVEFTVDHPSKTATVYVLDGNAKKAAPVDAAALTLALKLTPPVSVTLTAKPDAGDPAGKSSRFVGTHPALGVERKLAGSVAGKVGGKPYSGDF